MLFSTPVAMETIKDGRQTTLKKIPTPPKTMHIEQNCLLNFNWKVMKQSKMAAKQPF